jgi:CPA2 family monovalent cation:H+ antiporter-2
VHRHLLAFFVPLTAAVVGVAVAHRMRLPHLKEAGGTEAIPEVLEGSLVIAAETLVQIGIPVELAMARGERYASLRKFYRDYLEPLRR